MEYKNKMKNEAEVLNNIEKRIRLNKKVSQKEVNLLFCGYSCFSCVIPGDILNRIEMKGEYKIK